MKIERIHLRNVLGVEEMEFVAGTLTVVTGTNGTGKSSILEAIKSGLSGGCHDATLLRAGSEKGEIVLEFDDGKTLTKKISQDESSITMRDQDGNLLKRPASILQEIVDEFSANPVEFLTAKPKDRARVLLESMPIASSPDELRNICDGLQVVSNSLTGLDLIDNAYRSVYDQRTTVNVLARDKEGAAKQIQSAIGNEDPDQVQALLNGAIAREQKIGADKAAEHSSVAETARADHADSERRIAEIKQDYHQRIQELMNEMSALVAKETAVRSEMIGASVKAKELIDAKYEKDLTDVAQERSALQERLKASIKSQEGREAARKAEAEAGGLKLESKRLTGILERITEYRNSLIANLPIQGLEVRDGDVFRDGVQFDRLNTAQRVGIAVQVAALRAKGLGVVCMDGLECLDKETWDAFVGAALDSRLQMFVTRVSDEPLSVEAINQNQGDQS